MNEIKNIELIKSKESDLEKIKNNNYLKKRERICSPVKNKMIKNFSFSSLSLSFENLNTNNYSSSENLNNNNNNNNTIIDVYNNEKPIDERNYKNTYVYYFNKVLLHISFHLFLLSLLEPLFFFYFAIPMERDLFYSQLNDLSSYQHALFEGHDAQEIRNEQFYKLFIQFLSYENINIDGFYNELEDNSIVSQQLNNSKNKKLENQAFFYPIYIGIFTFCYFIFVTTYFKYKYIVLEIFFEHILLMFFVFFYEYIFFTNIILNYSPFTSDELIFFLINCFFDKLIIYYPEMKIIQQNVTVSCN